MAPAIEFDADQIGVGRLDARKKSIPKEGCCGRNLHESIEQDARSIELLEGDISCWHKADLSFLRIPLRSPAASRKEFCA